MGKKSPFFETVLFIAIDLCDIVSLLAGIVVLLNFFGAVDFAINYPLLPVPEPIRFEFRMSGSVMLFFLCLMRILIVVREEEELSSLEENLLRRMFLAMLILGSFISCAMAHSLNPFE